LRAHVLVRACVRAGGRMRPLVSVITSMSREDTTTMATLFALLLSEWVTGAMPEMYAPTHAHRTYATHAHRRYVARRSTRTMNMY
jgi:hypothetical protein